MIISRVQYPTKHVNIDVLLTCKAGINKHLNKGKKADRELAAKIKKEIEWLIHNL